MIQPSNVVEVKMPPNLTLIVMSVIVSIWPCGLTILGFNKIT